MKLNMMNRKLTPILILILALAFVHNSSYAQPVNESNPRRFVNGNILTSKEFPNIQVQVDKAFQYLGKFQFTIHGMAKGERYVFAELKANKIKRLFIFQFEEFLPESTETYNYSFKDALDMGGYKFKQNTFAFSNQQSKNENPTNEGTLTADFLAGKGYLLEDELMASRFVTVPDAERKHELILFYIESIQDSGQRLEEFYKGDEKTAIWDQISKELTQRSTENFVILK